MQEVKGQEKTKEILFRALKNGRLAGPLLFVGPEGVGKGLMAKYLAQSVNCLNSDNGACGECSSCLKIEKMSHLDVYCFEKDSDGMVKVNGQEINSSSDGQEERKSSAIKIKHVRFLEERIQVRTYEGRKKVFIIIEAQHLTPEAGNALLKTLEEPPGDSLIILTSGHAEQLLPTILSRCQKVRFNPLGPEALEEILRKDYKFDEKLSHFLAYFSQGRLGKAIEFSRSDILREKNDFLDNFTNGAITNEYFGNDFFVDRNRLTKNLEVLLDWFRDLLMLKIGLDSRHLINNDRIKDLERCEAKYSLVDLEEILGDIILTFRLLQQNINAKIGFFALRAKICQN